MPATPAARPGCRPALIAMLPAWLFALPSFGKQEMAGWTGLRETFWQDSTPNAARIGEVKAAVKAWRDGGDLLFADLDWQSTAELSGSLDHPP